jgi:hypothetical protein
MPEYRTNGYWENGLMAYSGKQRFSYRKVNGNLAGSLLKGTITKDKNTYQINIPTSHLFDYSMCKARNHVSGIHLLATCCRNSET